MEEPPSGASRTGAYVLVLRLLSETFVRVGRLGLFSFEPGTYAYVGSAMSGLDMRVARHQRPDKKLRWHIDYLLQHAEIVDVLEFESAERQECALNWRVRDVWSTSYPVPRFGASDCRCPAHLHLLPGGASASSARNAGWHIQVVNPVSGRARSAQGS